MRFGFATLFMVSLILMSTATPSVQAALSWKGEEFAFRTRGTPLPMLLRDFGANYRVPVVVSESVNDVFIGSLDGEQPEATLNRLARLYNLAWYYDGETLYVYKAREVTSGIVSAQFATPKELMQYLKRQHVVGVEGCRLQEVGNFQAFEVLGVPACVQRVTRLAEDIDSKAKQRATSRESVRVFPLRFASAADVTYQYRQQEVVVPGLVTILNQMKSGNTSLSGEGNGASQSLQGQTQFSADPNQNAIVVRAREANMSVYQSLIQQMDKRNHQIEIAVAIIDVDEAHLRQLGVDWSGRLGGGAASVAFNTGIGDSSYMSTVVGNSSEFMAKVSALQQRSHAQVLSQPSVVTLNNVQAILDKNITFYTKVESENSAKLESVTSGTLMRVTPRVVEDLAGKGKIEEIMLMLNIQDGQQLGATSAAEQLPQVQNSEITTQAVLRPGQSLLLGGFVQDKKVSGKRGIPLLGDIPYLGRLFGTERDEVHSVVRLFLIKATPIVVNR